jgi:AcrR family transcriptional regulator
MLMNSAPLPDALTETPTQGRSEANSRFERREAQFVRILQAARTCFLKSGFQGASMGDICAEANMSPGALYRYFPSKESLVEAICAADREQDVKILLKIVEAPCIIEGMTCGLLAHADQVHQTGMAPLFSEIFVEAQRNPAIHETFERSMCDATNVIGKSMQEALDRGEIDPVLPLDVLLPVMMAMGHGLVTHDLPRKGISTAAMEPAVRAMIIGLLRPAMRDGENMLAAQDVQLAGET